MHENKKQVHAHTDPASAHNVNAIKTLNDYRKKSDRRIHLYVVEFKFLD